MFPLESMGETGENVAERWSVSREDQDAFALESQRRWRAAAEAGRFDDELVAVGDVAGAVAGVDPRVMGIGPVPAVRKLLDRADVAVGDLDLVELNEAFASQSLAVVRELGLDPAKVNVNGGAIALGHPLGMTGARLVVTLLHELRRRGGRYGLATLCVGVGQGQAALFERDAAT
jgi:acetyl-CoA acetyltransferase